MNPIKHVAIIMDGNGRWGLKNKNSRNLGHKEGLKTVEKIIKVTIKKKIKFLTLYAFSTENWKRPKKEINFLFNLLESFLLSKISTLNKQNIKLKIIGKKSFSKKINALLNKSEKKTFNNKRLQINLALNYGSKSELIHSINIENQPILFVGMPMMTLLGWKGMNLEREESIGFLQKMFLKRYRLTQHYAQK